jgi:hypothetical protein
MTSVHTRPTALEQTQRLFEQEYLAPLTTAGPQAQARPPVPDTSWHPAVRARLRLPHAEQARFIQSPAKRKVIRAGRRGGKTCGVALIAVEAFLAGHRVLYATPTQDQADRFWYEVKRALEPVIARDLLVKNETRHYVELPRTETRIKAKTAWDADSLRGDYADVLILDEYQLMAESAWGEVGAPMLLDNNGDAIFVYTPPSVHTRVKSKAKDKRHAAKLFKAAAADTTGRWATFHFTSHANPYISTDALDDITHDMTVLAHRQEILAEDIEEVVGALWTQALLDETRVTAEQVPPLVRVAVALDPAGTSQETADEMGIIAGGKDARGHGYTLQDASRRGTPAVCARQAILLYDHYQADVLIGESNNGGEWIGTVVQFVAAEMYRQGERATPHVHYKMVHASRGKQTRAEPVSAEFEHHRCHHVGTFPELEAEQTGWVPGMPSPSRMDAEVWLYTELLLGAHVPRDLSLAPALEGMQQPSLSAQGATPPRQPDRPGRGPQGERLPRHWPGGASRPRFGGRVFRDEYDEDL